MELWGLGLVVKRGGGVGFRFRVCCEDEGAEGC